MMTNDWLPSQTPGLVSFVNRTLAGVPTDHIEAGYFGIYHPGCSMGPLHLDNHHTQMLPRRQVSFIICGSHSRLFYGCSYMYHLSGNNRRDSHFMGS